MSITCKKVASLMSMYIDEKLDDNLKSFVQRHLEVCPSCYNKYVTLKKMLAELKDAYSSISVSQKQPTAAKFNIREHDRFHDNLSSYLDNELPLDESVDMKKYMIQFPSARDELERMYRMQKAMKTAFENIKPDIGRDFAHNTCLGLQGKETYLKKRVLLKVATFAGIFAVMSGFLAYNFYSKPEKKEIEKDKTKTIYVMDKTTDFRSHKTLTGKAP